MTLVETLVDDCVKWSVGPRLRSYFKSNFPEIVSNGRELLFKERWPALLSVLSLNNFKTLHYEGKRNKDNIPWRTFFNNPKLEYRCFRKQSDHFYIFTSKEHWSQKYVSWNYKMTIFKRPIRQCLKSLFIGILSLKLESSSFSEFFIVVLLITTFYNISWFTFFVFSFDSHQLKSEKERKMVLIFVAVLHRHWKQF